MTTDTTLKNMAALTTGSNITAANTVHELVINAINQLNANLVQQMAAMSLRNNNTVPPSQITVPIPPIQQFTIPTQMPYAGSTTQMNTFNVGQGSCGGRGGRHGQANKGSRGGGQNIRTPFANHMRNQTQGRRGGPGNNGNVQSAPGGAGMVVPPATRAGAYQSNITKMFVKWNVCYSCGFDIEDAHTSATCPHTWP